MQLTTGGTAQLAPITASDEEIRSALESAHLAPLMLTIAHLTGDLAILRGDIKPESAFLGPPDAGISDEQASFVRSKARRTQTRHVGVHARSATIADR